MEEKFLSHTFNEVVLEQFQNVVILTNLVFKSCLMTELDQDPSEWLERLFIHHKESVEKKMKRYKSSDMMLGGMVVKKCKDNSK